MAVRAEHVELAHGQRVALAASTFELPAGRVTALVGPNGAGKTTLLHAMAGLMRPRSGRLDVAALARPGGVAYVLQATKANDRLPLTVRETVTMGRYGRTGALRRLGAGDRAAIASALEALAITDLANRQLHELSGGQRQRALVAQGLAQEADVLLLDEPVSGLDIVSRDRILQVVDEQRRAGRTVVMSTHDLTDAARCDHLLLLAGRLVAAGGAADVLTDDNLAAAYGGRMLRLGDRTLLLDGH